MIVDSGLGILSVDKDLHLSSHSDLPLALARIGST